MQFLHPMAAPNCLRVPSVEQGALFVVQGLGRFSSAQGCFKVPVKMPCELERCGGGMFVLLMLILVLLTPSCGGVSSHGVTVCWSVLREESRWGTRQTTSAGGESQNGRGWKGPLRIIWPSLLPKILGL